jgi:protein TonB
MFAIGSGSRSPLFTSLLARLLASCCALGVTLLLFMLLPGLLHQQPGVVKRSPQAAGYELVQLAQRERPKAAQPREQLPQDQAQAVEKTLNRLPAQPLRSLDLSLEMPLELTAQLGGLFVAPAQLGSAPEITGSGSEFMLPDVFVAGDLDRSLISLYRQPPVYPFYASQRKIEGEVRVRFIVNIKGGVEDVEILSATPPEIFDQSVIRCVSTWRFEAGTVAGVPVSSWAETSISFVLQ